MRDVFEEHRHRLSALAYRLLGERADAEDVVQDLWLRWQRSNQGSIRNPEAWLVRVCSNACLDQLKSTRRKREIYPGQWLPDPWVYQGDSEEDCQRHRSLGQAYVWMLDNLNPKERVALALHEVFDWTYDEISMVLGQSVVSCRQIVFRARGKQRSLAPTAAKLVACDRLATENFVEALESCSAEQVLKMLSPDVVLLSDGGGKAFASPYPIVGSTRISNFLVTSARKTLPEREVVWGGAEYWMLFWCEGVLSTAMTLTTSEQGITQIFAHRNPAKLANFLGK